MSRCLKCNYELTFLERRRRYKCAKCSSLFTEKEIRLEEFKKHNKYEREKDKAIAKKEIRKAQNKRFRANPKNREVLNQKARDYRSKNRDKLNETSRKYYQEHKEEISKKRKEKTKDGKQNEIRKTRRRNNLEATRVNGRIEYWKRKQKLMAESRFDEILISKTFNKPEKILPTLILS